MDAMEAIRRTFFEECEEQLADMETGLLRMNDGDRGIELVNSVFRAIHSIKGGAGAFKLASLVGFAHTFETVLDHIRSARLEPDADVMRVMLRAADIISDLVRMSRAEEPIDEAFWRPLAGELEELIGSGRKMAEVDQTSDVFDFAPSMISFGDFGAGDSERVYEIEFAPRRELYASANEPAILLRELGKLGACEVTCDCNDVPGLDALDAAEGALRWSVVLTTSRDEPEIREVFEFVDGACELNVRRRSALEAAAAVSTGAAAGATEPAVEAPPLHADRIPAAVEMPKEAAAAPPSGLAQAAPAPATIRVDLDRVDRLINLVGELVINQAMLSQRVLAEGLAKSSSTMIGLEELGQLTREIQESVMAIRAQPVKSLFQRMSRIVREVSEQTGKDVRLKTEGEMTELDKTVIERLADPLTHMIRNAVDHGIEAREDRIAAGKNPEGVVRLTAAHRSGRVLIEIADDGAGIDRQRVLAKAISKGLVPPGAELSDAEIDNLLFLPGFSTAESISNISGRGVGMDVVRRSIQALGGRISISSRPGQGSCFALSLPLTLAVLDGMVVSAAGQTFVVPLTAIIETLRPAGDSVHSLGGEARVIAVRGRFVPLIDVGMKLGFQSGARDRTESVAILVESESGAPQALLVDSIEDQRQVVIKSVEPNYGKIRGIAAATILGDGRVALILDVDDVVSISRSDIPHQFSEARVGARIQ